jgi:hypothetical protein
LNRNIFDPPFGYRRVLLERMSDEELQQFIEATTLTLLALPGG